jgi:hypothetical protein
MPPDDGSIRPKYVRISVTHKAINYIYVVCSKSIEPLVGRNTFIDYEVQNPNPLLSSLLGNAHTSPTASAIVGNTSGTCLSEW